MSNELKQADDSVKQGMTQAMTSELEQMFGDLGKNWGWMMALGILFVIMGVVALGMPVVMTVATVFVFGAMLIVGGIFQIIDAFKCKGWKGVVWHVLIGLLYIAAGVIIMDDPGLSSLTLTLFLGAMIVAVGIVRIIMGIQLKPEIGWGWLVFGGIVSILLGAMILAKWPVSGLVVIGILVAVEMLVHGWSYIFLSLAAKNARKAIKEGQV